MARRVEESTVEIVITGDDLDPEEVTQLLGVKPTFACKKGVERDVGNTRIVQPTGIWMLEAKVRGVGNIEKKTHALLDKTTPDVERWRKVTSRFQGVLSCLANVGEDEEHDVILYEPRLVYRLAERGLGIVVDIYHVESDES